MSNINIAKEHMLDALCLLRDEWLDGRSTADHREIIESLATLIYRVSHEQISNIIPLGDGVVTLVFNNADATPKSTVLRIHRDSVAPVMDWYGAFYAGDRYTVTVGGRNVPMDQNGGKL